MDRVNDKSRLTQVESIFHSAMDAPAEERDTLIARLSNGDAGIIAEVKALLKATEDTDQLLEKPAAEAVKARQNTPQTIGPFRIIRLLGEGGMGCVYEAEQDSPRRRVALKVVYASVWSEAVRKRFEHEIEILAQLQHPGIARFYQAGTVMLGGVSNAYFAMELIQGQSLTTYLASGNLPLADQLELLARVCDAVHHAHQRGVIHRDLKPANIMVEPPRDGADSIGQPKVLDFGIARDTAADSATIVTRAGEFVGTLGYMSPEQCESKPLDTRSDVYALGVVCYEALTGQLPIDVRTRSVTEAIAMMKDASPTRISSVKATLKGDVETVVHKALAREPARRYESASELAADLRRIVRNEPILARPASGFYHFSKFARRNRLLVGSAAILFVALATGLAVSLEMYWRAESARKGEAEQTQIAKDRLDAVMAERKRADREAELTSSVQKYLVGDLLVAASPSRMGADVKLVDVLAYASDNLKERFPDRPEVQAEIRTRLAEVYDELGRYNDGASQSTQAMQILEKIGMEESERWIYAALTQESALRRMEKMSEALEVGKRSFEIAERTLPMSSSVRGNCAQSYAETLQKMGRFKEAEEIIIGHLPAAEALPDSTEANPYSSMLSTLHACYQAENRIEDAVSIARRAYEFELRVNGADKGNVLSALNNYINSLKRAKHYDEAATLAVDLPARANKVFPEGHPARFYLTLSHATVMRAVKNFDESLKSNKIAYDIACKIFDPYRWETERCVSERCYTLSEAQDHSEETTTWELRSLHIRLVAANIDERQSVVKTVQVAAREIGKATPQAGLGAGEIVERMWKEVDERSPMAEGRRARYCANLARAAVEFKRPDIATSALAAAEEALKASPRAEEDRAIINAARKELAGQ